MYLRPRSMTVNPSDFKAVMDRNHQEKKGHICQFVNDGNKYQANCVMKLKEIGNFSRLCLYAVKDLHIGEELLYDYGDQTRNLWWRRKIRL
ncbi:hypothetical protein KUTeg_023427 [Tegillarca granosa]|uniref:SET domain-containing protein n=1 Tax=Tegillarca granosa TaxID=220873 RepID=A0ABQ9E748_TEGGR|nr:hypothetical protein KUTeg_023427 [Tegillarca granosa]